MSDPLKSGEKHDRIGLEFMEEQKMTKEVKQVRFAARLVKKKRVAAYARVSSGKDAMLHSLSAQISYYSELIQSHGDWQFCGVYADEAMTGTKEERGKFQELLNDCREGKVDMIITKSISRFARNTVTLLEAVRELKGLGINVYFEEQNIHTISSEGELMLTLLSSFAQAESLSVSENMKWRFRKGFENGEFVMFTPLYGYDSRNGEITVNEEEAEIVRVVFNKALHGESMDSIARYLNERGIKGPRGGRYTGSRVREMLENEKYTGNAMLQKYFINDHLEKKKLVNSGQLPKYYVENSHEAIIDEEVFEEVKSILQTRAEQSKAQRSEPQKSVFTGLIRCVSCGAYYVHAYSHKKIWQCGTYKRHGKDACSAKSISDAVLEEVCCKVLGMDGFDEGAVRQNVASIIADKNKLIFILKDGREVAQEWSNPSRSRSWTPEMKERARQAELERRRKNDTGKNG